MSIAFFDIETGGFDAGRFPIITMCVADDQEDGVSVLVDSKSERQLIASIISSLMSYDTIVSWNGSRFDIPYINKRGEQYGLSIQHPNHIDLRFEAIKAYNLKSSTLDFVAKSFDVEAEKTPFDRFIWSRALQGKEDAIDYIIEHCVHDVLVLKQVYERMLEDGFERTETQTQEV